MKNFGLSWCVEFMGIFENDEKKSENYLQNSNLE